jgi:hypothetical protein
VAGTHRACKLSACRFTEIKVDDANRHLLTTPDPVKRAFHHPELATALSACTGVGSEVMLSPGQMANLVEAGMQPPPAFAACGHARTESGRLFKMVRDVPARPVPHKLGHITFFGASGGKLLLRCIVCCTWALP